MVYTLNTLNTNVIKSLGKSGVYFVVQLVKRLLGIALIFVGANFGIFGLLWAVTSVGYISMVINMIVNKRLINYGIWEQIKDVGVNYVVAAIIGLLVYFVCNLLPINQYWIMALEVVLYVSLYILVSIALKFDGYYTYMSIVKSKLNR